MPDQLQKPVFWIGSSREDLKSLPDPVQDSIGFVLYEVQKGQTPPEVKPLSGFGGTSVLEIVGDYNTDTYRAVFTVRFKEVIYVLHVFQKKSKQGIATPTRDMDLIRSRLKRAEVDYRQWISERRETSDGNQ